MKKLLYLIVGDFPIISSDKKVEEYFSISKSKKNLYALTL